MKTIRNIFVIIALPANDPLCIMMCQFRNVFSLGACSLFSVHYANEAFPRAGLPRSTNTKPRRIQFHNSRTCICNEYVGGAATRNKLPSNAASAKKKKDAQVKKLFILYKKKMNLLYNSWKFFREKISLIQTKEIISLVEFTNVFFFSIRCRDAFYILNEAVMVLLRRQTTKISLKRADFYFSLKKNRNKRKDKTNILPWN